MTSLLGRILGEYRITTTMGSGALGETFRAESVRGDGRAVAVKLMHAHLASDPTFPERFKREVATAAGLRHPHIIQIEDFGHHQGQFYIVMELLVDGSLRTLLQRREQMLPLRRGVALARQVADALAFAHGQNVLHRDVKPENILIRLSDTDRDIAKLADVGLTRLTESGVTVGGNLTLGSFAYMSPEQCRGLAMDARSDIYSLGVVLYEVATGYPPFQVRTLSDALSKHTSAPPPPPRSVARDLPAELEKIILRCLAKPANERWQSAGELMRALDAVLATLPAGPVVRLQDRAAPAEPGGGLGPLVHLREGGAPAPAGPPKGRYRVQMEGSLGETPSATTPPPADDSNRIPVSLDAERRLRPTIPQEPRGEPVRASPAGDSRRIRVALDKQTLILNPGQPAVFSVTINNSGRTVDHFTVTVEGVPDSWVKVPPQGAQLNPGQRTTVPLTVTAPRSPESVAGDYPVTIRARSRENSGESGTAPATWTVQPFAQSVLTLAPSRVRGWRRGQLHATVRNQGNASARYTLSGADEEQRLRWDFAHPQVPLDPGQSATVRVRARAPLRLIGSSEHRPFTVRAEGASASAPTLPPEPPLVAQGQFVHRALIPTWLPPLLILVAAAAWFLLRDRGQLQIALQPASATVPIGGTALLSASVTDQRNEAAPDQHVSWSSRDTSIALVTDSGMVSGRREGTTLIVAQAGKRSATAQISVVPPRVETVTLAPKTLGLKIGASASLRALARDANGVILRRDFSWQSSDPTVVTVGGNGRVTAKAPGSATITAQTEAKTATADVTVAELPPGETPAGTADCVNYDPAPLKVASDRSAGWVLTDGSTNLLTLDNESDARQALSLARRYKSHCFLGRGNTRPNRSDYIIEYWESPTRAPTVIDAEDCVRYDPAALRISESGAQGFILTDGRSRLLAADTRKDAQKAWDIAQKSSMLCFIGRGNRRVNQRDYIVQYWK